MFPCKKKCSQYFKCIESPLKYLRQKRLQKNKARSRKSFGWNAFQFINSAPGRPLNKKGLIWLAIITRIKCWISEEIVHGSNLQAKLKQLWSLFRAYGILLPTPSWATILMQSRPFGTFTLLKAKPRSLNFLLDYNCCLRIKLKPKSYNFSP